MTRYSEDKYGYVNCDLCGRDEPELLFEAEDHYNKIPGKFDVVKCSYCGLVYVNPRPYGTELARYYPDEAGYYTPCVKQANTNNIFPRFRENLRNSILAAYRGYYPDKKPNLLVKVLLYPIYLVKNKGWRREGLPDFIENGNLLEVGCSYGLYLAKMREMDWQVQGVELNKKAVEFGQKNWGLDIINNTVDKANLPEKYYDVILLRMVLEHLPSPKIALAKLAKALKQGGKMYIIVPDFNGLEAQLFKAYCYTLQVPNHLYHFTPQTLKGYIDKAGLRIKRIMHNKVDRDFVASAKYLQEAGINKWLYPLLSNFFIRKIILRLIMEILAGLGRTSRMTVYAEK